MRAEVILDIPEKYVAKLATGDYERVGGVLRDSNSKEVVAWLRETSPSPVPADKFPFGKLNEMLQVAGNAASILNLGATVAFGVATLKKLNRIEGKLDIMSAKLDELNQKVARLGWAVEIGFANTLQALDSIKSHQEIELAGELNSAASMAWSAQFLEPGSNQRMMRLENAYHTASNIKERLIIHARKELEQAIEAMEKRRDAGDFGFAIDNDTMAALFRVRQAIAACTLNASICAEADDIYSAGSKLSAELDVIGSLLQKFGGSSCRPDARTYGSLLSYQLNDVMSAQRVDSWSRRYDPSANGIFGVVEMIRNDKAGGMSTSDSTSGVTSAGSLVSGSFAHRWILEGSSAARSSGPSSGSRQSTSYAISNMNARPYFDLMDGLNEDIQRMAGYALEYKAASQMGLSSQEYREMLCLDDVPEGRSVVLLSSPKLKVAA